MPDTEPDTTDLLRAAAEWRLLGLLFSCPQGDWQAEVAALASEVDDQQLKAAADAARTEASEGLYHTTFGPGGPAAAREVSYLQSHAVRPILGRARAACTKRSRTSRPAMNRPIMWPSKPISSAIFA